jgi:hypothetical protein
MAMSIGTAHARPMPSWADRALISELAQLPTPSPFTWTKTADEILERLASHFDRIPGAGH